MIAMILSCSLSVMNDGGGDDDDDDDGGVIMNAF